MRTNLSLANSFRTLRAYLAEITRQIGVGLGAAIRHAVVGLNMLMKYVLKATQAFATFMQKIFGKYEGGASFVDMDMSGMSDDMGDFADGADNAADGLDDAADSAEKLKKDLSVLPFDELNQLNKDQEKTSSSKGKGAGSGGGIGGLGDVGDFDNGMFTQAVGNAERELTDFEKFLKDWHDKCAASLNAKDWEGLGANIAWGLNQGIDALYDALDPEKAAEKINPWLDAFSTTVNSLTDNLEWEKMGGAIGRGITILVNAANRLLDPKTGIDFEALGNGLGNGFMGAVRNINWTGVGNLISNKFMVGWRIFKGFVDKLDAKDIGNAIRDAIGGAVDKLDAEVIGSSLGTFITKCATIIKTGFGKKETWVELGTKIGNGINAFLRDFDGKEVAEAANAVIDALKTAIGTAFSTTDKSELIKDIKDFITNLDWVDIAKFAAPIFLAKMAPTIASSIIAHIGLKTAISGAVGNVLSKALAEAGASAAVSTAGTTAASSMGASVTAGLGGIAGTIGLAAGAIGLAVIGGIWGQNEQGKQWYKDATGEFQRQTNEGLYNVENAFYGTGYSIQQKQKDTADSIIADNKRWVDDLVFTVIPQYVTANGTAEGSVADLRRAVYQNDDEMIAKLEEWGRENANYTGQIVIDNQNVATQAGIAAQSIKDSNSEAETSIGNLAGKYKGLGDEAAKDLSSVSANAEKLAQKHKTDLEDGAAKSVTNLQNATETGAVKSIDAWEDLSEKGTHAVDDMYDDIRNKLEDLVDLFDDAGRDATNAIKDSLDVYTAVSDAFSSIGDFSNDAYNYGVDIGQALADGISSISIPCPSIDIPRWDWVDLGDGAGFSVPYFEVNWYKRGGLFTDATIAGFGEAGNEAALPLENKRAMNMIANAIIDNADGGFGMDADEMANAVARGYAMAQMMNQGNERPIQFNATLYTEDNEVLARAVARGQESIDYRNNATPKLSY